MSLGSDIVTSSANVLHLIGRVKWFNTKAGYGFITITDGTMAGTDVFVHHSDVNVVNQQYKYLVQGEYIEFDLTKVDSQKYEWQASNVSGIKGGKLMCETRYDLKVARNEYKSNEPVVPREKEVSDMKKQHSVRIRGEGPRARIGEKKEWTLVENNNVNPRPDRRRSSNMITIQPK
jgi:cold shock CspA family protein